MRRQHVSWRPSQDKKFQAGLRYAVQLFKEGKSCPEKAVNEKLATLQTDMASLRRGLIENRLMQRQNGIYNRI